jgi:hypothetical protein
MVGNAGNAPARHFQFYFATSDSVGQLDHFPKIGCGGENHTHLKKFMRLLSVL